MKKKVYLCFMTALLNKAYSNCFIYQKIFSSSGLDTSDGSGPKKTGSGRARAGPGLEPFPEGRASGWAGLGPFTNLILKNIFFLNSRMLIFMNI